ncbi:hypothetical protein C8A05DRAFT_12171 [Staphylotrichum tortipilum]|uniref:Uncharacterized protein n=1 Tax=Staphylotrichum tortipilum TaxID=2831512 RepID=A0AAN6RWI9_9PEZI|nr:hypothetical protein C8A05DRAFT_12171 [Staphylotrichum longicolle]
MRHLCQAVARQQEVVKEQRATAQLIYDANQFLEVERLFAVDMQEEIERLRNAQGILDDLNARLSQAIAVWSHLALEDASQAQSPSLPYPSLTVPQLSLDKPLSPTPPVSGSHCAFHPGESGMSSCIHCLSQQQMNETGFLATSHPLSFPYQPQPTQWWMQEKDHYGLCQQNEQGQLEGAARAAQFIRAHMPAHHHSTAYQVSQPQHNSFAHQVSQTQHHSFTQNVSQGQQRQAPPPALQLPPIPAGSMPNGGVDWSEPDVMWLDNDFDPKFWQKNLRPGDLWARRPRRAIPEEDNLSPRTLTADPRI